MPVVVADAFMTGAAFAALLPLVAGKIAADPTHAFAEAHKEALQRAAEAAQGPAAAATAAGAAPSHYYPLLKGLVPQPLLQQQQAAEPQQPSSSSDAVQQQQPQVEQQVDLQQQQQHKEVDEPSNKLLGYVAGLVGRLNITFSDLPYAALWGQDPIPDRPHTFHLSGLQEGARMDELWRTLKRLGLGTVRDVGCGTWQIGIMAPAVDAAAGGC